jgi:hypothetical protein
MESPKFVHLAAWSTVLYGQTHVAMAYQQPLIMQADHVDTDISYNTSATGLKPGHVALSAVGCGT